MTPELVQAQFLVKNLGKKEATSHVMFVLSYEYGLSKEDLRVFWTRVKALIPHV